MTIGERIKQLRVEAKMPQTELAKRIQTTKQNLYKYENGIITNIPTDKIAEIAEIFHVSPAYIMGWDDARFRPPEITSDVVTFPVLGTIAAGYDELAVEDWSGKTAEVPASYLKGRKKDEFFVLSVHGDSMYPLYMNGDKVLILKQSTLNRSGEIGAILYNGDNATLKKVEYVEGEDWMKLIPINPAYQPTTIKGSDLEQCHVLGVPRLLIREIDL